jgi:hypothetical protein
MSEDCTVKESLQVLEHVLRSSLSHYALDGTKSEQA